VQLRVNRSGLFAALALGAALGGCANLDVDTGQAWFQKPLDIGGSKAGGYTFSELAETKQHQRPITPNDLVDANGTCAARTVPQSNADSRGNQTVGPAPDTASLLGQGIALGMSECDVVFRAGQPTKTEIGNNPNGDRTAVLTVSSGPRPGMYRFERGSLTEMIRTAQPVPPPQPEKKKPTKSAKSQKKGDQT
jgi:hypothetical protein